MCLAIPGKVVSVDGKTALVDFGGLLGTARTDLLPDAELGEYVLVHAGFAIQRIVATEAKGILAGFGKRPDGTGDEVDRQHDEKPDR